MITRVTLVGGPFDGLQKTVDKPPSGILEFALMGGVDAPAGQRTTFAKAVYKLARPLPDDSVAVGIYTGDQSAWDRFKAPPEDSGILCAHCGHDPATGEAVDDGE